ncbi:MAG: NUDIX hydrolase [Candidatus Bathyarchaeia archaeon]
MTKQTRERKFLGATVSAIIERFHDGEWEVLLQTRWKPEEDAKYSGLLEIPGGRMEYGEDVYTTLKREVNEECGLNIESIKPRIDIKTEGKYGTASVAFVPFCGEQFLGSNYIGFVFVCTAKGELTKKGIYDAKEPRWIKFSELKKILSHESEKIYPYHLSALKYYVDQKEKELV